jgi:hypothetical protein
MAGHVVADEHLGGGRWRELEVGKETRHLLEPVERRAGPLGELSQLRLGQEPMPVLDVVEFLDYHDGRRPGVDGIISVRSGKDGLQRVHFVDTVPTAT